MKNLFLTIILIICNITLSYAQGSSTDTPQSPADARASLINPGKGIGNINLGLTYTNVVDVMGQPLERRPLEQEKQGLLSRKLTPKKELPFFIDFDYVAEFNYSNNRTQYPIYTLYFKQDTLVYIVLSSYNYDLEKCRSLGINNEVFFGNGKEKLLKALGRSSVVTKSGADTELHDYLDKGVSFFLQKNAIRAIYIYKPLARENLRQYLRLLNGK